VTDPHNGDVVIGGAPNGDTRSPAWRTPTGPTGRPVWAVAVLLAVLVAALIGDRVVRDGRAAVAAAPGPAVPSLAAPGALSSTWFCPGLGATADSPTRGRVIVADPGPTDLAVTATFYPSDGGPVSSVTRTVAAYTRLTLRLEELASAPYVATTVRIEGSGGAVEQEVQGPLGESIAPCSTASSGQWYFAAGRTDGSNTLLLSLFNPFAADAIANVTFATDQGPAAPDAYQSLLVPANGVVVLNVGDRVRIRASVAATVTVRSGRLIVDKLLEAAGPARGQARGLALTLGVTAPGSSWFYPEGTRGNGVTEHLELYNPGSREAAVQVTPTLDSGSADPFSVTVAAQDTVTLQIDQQDRIPPGVGAAWAVTSTNGVPVVAELLTESGSPARLTGVTDTFGAPAGATRWVLAAGSAADGADEWVELYNPGPASADVRVVASGDGSAVALAGLAPFTLDPGARRVLHIGDVWPHAVAVLDVSADHPIVVARTQARLGGPGLSMTIGIAAR